MYVLALVKDLVSRQQDQVPIALAQFCISMLVVSEWPAVSGVASA
jgi:hypothetical protein